MTVCTKDRRRILDNDRAHEAIRKAWGRADRWVVGKYVLMPDHAHLFCAPATAEETSLERWVHYWKELVSKDPSMQELRPIWQANFWDKHLRNGESYGAKWQYVANNPVRHGLVEDPDDWPFQGEMHELAWENLNG